MSRHDEELTRIFAKVGTIHSTRSDREAIFTLNPEPVQQMQNCLDRVSWQWDYALARLKSSVEK